MTHLSEVEERFSQQDTRLDELAGRVEALGNRMEELWALSATQEEALGEIRGAIVNAEEAVVAGGVAAGAAAMASARAGAPSATLAGLAYGESFDNPGADAVRETVDILAAETGYATDEGDEPERLRGTIYPRRGQPGQWLTISGLSITFQRMTIGGHDIDFGPAGKGSIRFQVPDDVKVGKVVHVFVETDNVGTFSFPLAIDPPTAPR